eukprot:CAMPEP_0174912506 /NCGR_PEP_ID=MMETSP0167-20121228/79821_1 /TAXON_ID=38298 /ORGANISM="Rhodella maculata, Strain CCMP736" /LENGTH=154 /DNA_ID=CAMNT_0016157161 /DNA_START=156 /DNA_END=620 /DNA_ORIENTATION=+
MEAPRFLSHVLPLDKTTPGLHLDSRGTVLCCPLSDLVRLLVLHLPTTGFPPSHPCGMPIPVPEERPLGREPRLLHLNFFYERFRNISTSYPSTRRRPVFTFNLEVQFCAARTPNPSGSSSRTCRRLASSHRTRAACRYQSRRNAPWDANPGFSI